MSSGSSPRAPDYVGAAKATADSSEAVNTAQTYANRPNIITPWGTQTWDQRHAVDPATGKLVTQWDQNIQLSPDQQAALNAQTAITTARSNAALSMMPGVLSGFGVSGPSSFAPSPSAAPAPRAASGTNNAAIAEAIARRDAPPPPSYGNFLGFPLTGISPASPGGQAPAAPPVDTMQYQNRGFDGETTAPPMPQIRQDTPATPPPPQFGYSGPGGQQIAGPQGGFQNGYLPPPAQQVSPITRGGGAVFGGSTSGAAPAAPSLGAAGQGITVDPNYWRAAGQGAALGFQQPLQLQRQQQLETQLSNMGIPRGSQAWANEMRGLQDQNARDQLQAFGAGQSEANMLFGQALQANNQQFGQGLAGANFGLQADNQAFGQNLAAQGFNQTLRQQQIAEMLAARSQPLNEMNALLSGQQISMPQMPGSPQAGRAQGTDYMGAANSAYGASMDAANARNAANASNTQAGLTTAAMAAMYFFSDARLKKDIELLFTLPNGINVYKYNFIGREGREIGVLAQEVQEIMPQAVMADEKGFLKVNYDMVLA